MGPAPETLVGQTPPSVLGWASEPGQMPLRNVEAMGEAPGDDQVEPGLSPATGSEKVAVDLVRTAQRVAGWFRSWRTARTWWSTASLPLSLVVGAVFGALTTLTLALSLATAWIVGLGAAVRAGGLRFSARLARLDRNRIERLWGVRIDPLALPEIEPGTSFRGRQHAWNDTPRLWRLPAYQLLRLPVAAALGCAGVVWWWATIVCFVLAGQPPRPVPLLGGSVGPVHLSAVGMAGLVIAGVIGLLAWPGAVRVVPAVDIALARWLLGPSRASQLSSEVVRLGRARSLAVESAEAERRRIERDLHDGLQPQLVNLALSIGLAKARLQTDPEAAGSLFERAHREAKQAAEDLRNLVRGIHPSVLDERGLDAALSGLVASCAVPVFISVDLPRRPSTNAEATAYFVVAEAITNVTKHARAHKAVVRIGYVGDAVAVVVEDDGRGGAHVEPAGGLAGLAARVASVDGTFGLSSPEGGPTRMEAVIPCEP